jgi:hypothetical protein
MSGKMVTMSKYLVYTTPHQNSLALTLLDASRQTLVVGDFIAYFRDIGYKNVNEAGKTVEDFV